MLFINITLVKQTANIHQKYYIAEMMNLDSPFSSHRDLCVVKAALWAPEEPARRACPSAALTVFPVLMERSATKQVRITFMFYKL